MIDIHCHIVYGVDDGSYSRNESLRMAAEAIESGITDIIATPHCIPAMFENYVGPDYYAAFDRLYAALHDEGMDRDLTVHRGMEAFATPSTLAQFDRGALHCLGSSDYLLIECDFAEDPEFFSGILKGLLERRIRPVVAHPERYFFAHDDIRRLLDMVDMGCVLQLDTESITGAFGRKCRETAFALLDRGAAQLAASDAHDSDMRRPDMREAADIVADSFSPRYAQLLFDTNPRRILENRPLLFRGQYGSEEGRDGTSRHHRRRDGFMTDEEYWGI